MATTIPPIRYQDPEYQKAHNNLFLGRSKQPLEHVLPPGVSQGDFDQAIKGLVQTLGKANVFTGEAIRDYVDPYEVLEVSEGRKVPSAAVTPTSLEALQAVLRIANRFSIPVWTFSRGKNIGYGGPAPRLPGSLAVDLHRMNKIIEVNEKFAYAVVEPGVTFTDLYTYCAANKLEVWPSVPSLGWGSVIGNVSLSSIRQF
jgi:FAD/FMN-containing dehydrogenase